VGKHLVILPQVGQTQQNAQGACIDIPLVVAPVVREYHDTLVTAEINIRVDRSIDGIPLDEFQIQVRKGTILVFFNQIASLFGRLAGQDADGGPLRGVRIQFQQDVMDYVRPADQQYPPGDAGVPATLARQL
jgi:hypothetical protein